MSSNLGYFAWALLAASLIRAPAAWAGEFADEIERDFPLRSIGRLQITNMRGDIIVHGWAMDRIRVRAHRKVKADTPEQAQNLLRVLDFRYRNIDRDIELSAEYGRGLSIQDKLKERENPQAEMQMEVYAPANLHLGVWAVAGKVMLRNWNAPIEVRTSSGAIDIEEVHAESIAALCPSCSINVRESKASVRCMGGSAPIRLEAIEGAHIYVESTSGEIQPKNVSGEQLYVSQSGAINGQQLRGHIEFHTQQASVALSELSGFLSGRTKSGKIIARLREWSFVDKAFVESIEGDVEVTLPYRFSGDVELRSGVGAVRTDFPLHKGSGRKTPRNESLSAGQLNGRIGDGGEVLKITSEKGRVTLLRGN